MWQIIGAGAIGCLWAVNLLCSGQKVRLITRDKNSHQGLTYQDLQGKKEHYDCPNSRQLIASSMPLLVCVKAPQIKQALLAHLQQINEQQVIILMHNGMGCAEQVAEILPKNPIICATTANSCLLHSPLNIQQTGLGITYLGAFNEPAKVFSGLSNTLNSALNNTHWATNIEQKLWLKLLINIAINPLTAIFQINNGQLVQPKFQKQIEQMITEMMPLLAKLALPFDKTELLKTINDVIIATANNYSSMNRDIHFQRTTENDYINGYLLKKASQHQIETPLIKSLYQEIKVLEHHSQVHSNGR